MSPSREVKADPEDDELDIIEPDIDEDDIFGEPDESEYEPFEMSASTVLLPVAVSNDLAEATRDYLSRDHAAFAVRLSDGNSNGYGTDPLLAADFIRDVARLNRWVANARIKDAPDPNLLAALPGSLALYFAAGRGEDPVRLPGLTESRSDVGEYPSRYGARGVARLLALSDREEGRARFEDENEGAEALRDAVADLGKRAVSTYMKTLTRSAEHGLTLDWLTAEGLRATVDAADAELAVETLDVTVEMLPAIKQTVVGLIDKPNKEKAQVGFEPLDGPRRRLSYDPAIEEDIRRAWGRTFIGTVEVIRPSNPSLPRAPRTQRTLVAIEATSSDPSRLPKRRVQAAQRLK